MDFKGIEMNKLSREEQTGEERNKKARKKKESLYKGTENILKEYNGEERRKSKRLGRKRSEKKGMEGSREE
jgi:hypothetical protein